MAARWKVWTALAVVDIVWGSTYLAIAYTVEGLPPLLAASARFALAAALLAVLVLIRRGRSAFRATRRAYGGAAVVGALLLVGGNGGVMLAQDRGLPSGLTALIVAAVPLEVALFRLLYRDRPTARTLLGVSLGFVGLAVLLLPGTRPADVAVLVALIPLAGSALWALGSVIASRISLPKDRLVTTAAQMLAGSIGLGLAGVLRGERPPSEDVPTSAWIALAYLVVFGAVLAFTAFSWLLGNVPVSTVSTYAYVNPVVAVALGALVLGEQVTPLSLVGGLITIIAVAVVVTESPGTAGQVPVVRQGRLRRSAT